MLPNIEEMRKISNDAKREYKDFVDTCKSISRLIAFSAHVGLSEVTVSSQKLSNPTVKRLVMEKLISYGYSVTIIDRNPDYPLCIKW